jgi:hypothetical protein
VIPSAVDHLLTSLSGKSERPTQSCRSERLVEFLELTSHATVNTAGLGAGMTEAIFAVTPSETIK